MAAIHPTPKVSEFYDFFSFSHLTSPILNLRRYERKEGEKRDDKNLQWKACTSSCISKGVLYFGKAVFPKPLPGGSSAKSQSSFCQSEDENWGGNGGGRRRDGEHDIQPWATEFAILAWLPCETEEERVVRDRKAFLLYNQFVDVSIFKAVEAISRLIDSNLHTQDAINGQKGAILHEDHVIDLTITVKCDTEDASLKSEVNIKGNQSSGVSAAEVAQRNLRT